MKIGIMTWLHNGNYGTVLQAYALQHYLRSEGYDVQNIDFSPTVVEKVKNLIKSKNSFTLFSEKFEAMLTRKKADQEASKAREDWINPRLTMIKIGSWVLVAGGICGLVISLVIEGPVWTAILLSIYCLISSVSAYDTVFSRKSVINDWLIKQSYQYETKIREEKLKEYSSLLTVEESIIEEANTDLVGV